MKKQKTKKSSSVNLNAGSHSSYDTELFMPMNSEWMKRERAKAKELKKTNWWKKKLKEAKCYYCDGVFKKESLSMDHLVPVVRGGRSLKNNVVVACKKCNSEKKYKTLIEIRLGK